MNKVIPSCVVAHYFFPKGYDHYEQAFLRIHSKYEKDFVKILEKFPCTTYIFPLEKGLIINLFHERAGVLLPVIEKVEEKAFIDDYLLHIPIASASLK
ncbi:MAG: hypothetical protein HXS47_01020 [Theionarchaea archaeon]|nr:hypothetical protein [Theionarchaea archaeon]